MAGSHNDPSRCSEDFALIAHGVTKTFRSQSGADVPALAGLDLTVRRGELVVLIGPTGCGKTTLLNVLGGLERPDDGEIRFAVELRPQSGVAYVGFPPTPRSRFEAPEDTHGQMGRSSTGDRQK
jgi:ABC-type oligopeptide transport system ATPase subunit